MKLITSILASLTLASLVHAETKFPRGSFEVAELAKAKEQAAKDGRDLAFILTDKATSCGLCQGAAEAFIDAVKSKAVIVYVASKDDGSAWKMVPASVKKALGKGKFIPTMAVTDATGENVSASIIYEEYQKDSRKAIRDLKKSLKSE